MKDQHKVTAKLVRLEPKDWEAIEMLSQYYGIKNDTDVIRFALREVQRKVIRETLPIPVTTS